MITTLSGPNSLMLRAELNRLVADFVAKHGQMAVEKIDCEEVEFERITEAIQSLPFLASEKLVVLHRPGTHKQFAESLESLVESTFSSTSVIIVEPKPDKRGRYFKLLQQKTELKQFNEMDARDLPRWVMEHTKLSGGSISSGDALYLVNRVGPNQLMLSNEIDKLITYDHQINRHNIDLLTEEAPQSTIFQLLDAAFAGNPKRVLKLYREQRLLKVEPLQIVAMLAWQLHILAIIKTAGGGSQQDIANEAGISPFVLQKSNAIAQKLSMQKLKEMVHELLELDVKLKSTAIDADEALKYYLLNISS